MPINELDRAYFASDAHEKLKELVQHLHNNDAARANKALNYYDGLQEQELVDFLNAHRKKWQRDDIIPRTRNITKMVVDKSGQIVYKTPPVYSVFAQSENDAPDEVLTEALSEALNKSDATETWINLDAVVRLLKTALVLVQWDDENSQLIYDILHRGNSLVKWDFTTKVPTALLYCLYAQEDYKAYRLYLADWILEFYYKEDGGGTIEIIYEDENPTGIVPVAKFDDVQAPRTGFWNVTPMDLVSMNEVYNLHVTESEYTMSWMKKPTLFTNAQLGESEAEELEEFDNPDVHFSQRAFNKLPTMSYADGGIKFGPSEAIQLDTTGVDSPFAEFKAPDVDIKPIDEVVEGWVTSFASDWSVSLRFGGQGQASSGFQLIVEELPNQELREKRQKMFAIGLTRLFDVIKIVLNTYGDFNFPEDSKLFVEFTDPTLPAEKREQEEIWTHRIENGRATLVDYFTEVKGMSQEEAVAKVAEIIEFNAALAEMRMALNPVAIPQQEDDDEDDDDAEEEEEQEQT